MVAITIPGASGTSGLQVFGKEFTGTDVDALWLEIYMGMFWKQFHAREVIGNRIFEDTIYEPGNDTKSVDLYGLAEADEVGLGEDILLPAGAGGSNAKLINLPKTRIRLECDHKFVEYPYIVEDLQALFSQNKARELAMLADRAADAMVRTHELRVRSKLLTTASGADLLTAPGTTLTKADAAASEGLDATNAANGLVVDSTPLTSGAAFEDLCFKMATVWDMIGIPRAGRFCLVRPSVAKLVPAQAGQQISLTASASFTPSRSLNEEIGGAGSYSQGSSKIMPIDDWEIIRDPYLYKLGKRINATKWGLNGLATGTPGNTTYAPNSASTFVQGSTNPDSWTDSGAAGNIGDAFNSVYAIFGWREAVGTLWKEYPNPKSQEFINHGGTLFLMRYLNGIRSMRTECAWYAASAKATTAEVTA